eukprot:10822811-Alexandrium_andersonii.AAC.1
MSPNTTARSCKPLQHWSQLAEATNSRELVGLARHVLTVKPASSPLAVALAVDWVRFCLRVNAKTLHASA